MATEEELLERLKDEEDALVERKPTPDRKAVREAVVAFANSIRAPSTGVLFLGVEDDGTPNDKITNPDEIQRQIRDQYLPKCYPALEGVQTYALKVDGKNIVAVVVPESRNRPHFTGPAYVRVGSATVAASEQKFQELIEERNDLVWALKPTVGSVVSVVEEIMRSAGIRDWGKQGEWTLSGVNNFFLTIQREGVARSFSLRRVVLEHDMDHDRPLLRVSLLPI